MCTQSYGTPEPVSVFDFASAQPASFEAVCCDMIFDKLE